MKGGVRREVDLLVVSHPCVVSVNQAVYVELQRLGWRLVVVVPGRWRHEYADHAFAPNPFPGMEDALLPLRVLGTGRVQRHIYLASAGSVLRSFRPRIVFLEQEPFSLPALQWGTAAAKARIPFGVQADENLDRSFPFPARAIRSWVLPRAGLVAARSPAAGKLVLRWGATGRVALVPHAVPAWSPAQRFNSDMFTVGFAGRLIPEKGVRDLLSAVRLLPGPVRLLLVGDGSLRQEVEENKLDNGELQVLSGLSHERMPEAYAQMDVLVLPSRTTARWAEQFGRVLVEALWCGVPIVGSNSGEIPWVIDATGGGRVFPEGDVVALAAALSELQGEPRLRRDLAMRGRAAVERMFGVEASANALHEVLNKALEDAHSPGVSVSG